MTDPRWLSWPGHPSPADLRLAGLDSRAVVYLMDLEDQDRSPRGAMIAYALEAARAAYASVTYCPRHRPPFGSEPARVYRAHPPRPDGFACDCGETR